ncbi:hypothetical protein [Lewinella sp. W8]|uniref:hypothetical protein n=1 Tax=Lewinella sp. W8 TaxID=2528208 RepID=UPI001067A171|nr:hypothetical protein [Lewinella sp. W8]MTB52393.1 hypothetical protein [Lewinella sp. W8]
MKTLQLLCFLLLTSMLTAQQSVRIDFSPGAPGDYDLMLRDNLERSGFRAFINYGERTDASDFILQYRLEDLKRPSPTRHRLQLTLLDGKGNVLKQGSAKVNAENNPGLGICRGLEDLFDYRLNCADCKQYPLVTTFNVEYSVNKVDSAAYLIVAFGHGLRKHAGMRKGFLRKAEQYLDGFSFYFLEANYEVPAAGYTYKGPAIIGWLSGHETPGVQEELKVIPVHFELEVELELTMGGDGK